MSEKKSKKGPAAAEDPRRESGLPGGGQGRTDEPGRTGVWPGSGPWPSGEAPIQQPGSFGQGERGPEGYQDSGSSSLEGIHELMQGRSLFERAGLLVRDIMTRSVECVRLDTTLQEAAQKMRDFDIGPLPVCGDDDRLAGLVTDRDITVRAVAEGKDPYATPVREIMTSGVVFCMEDQPITEAAKLMEDRQVRRLAVLDQNQHLVGILSLGDLAVRTQDKELAGEAIEAVSEPAHAC